MKFIELTQNQVAIVDDDDFEDLNKYSWSAACDFKLWYARRAGLTSKHSVIRMHRQIMGVTNPKIFVDHKNGNSLDNRKENLRLCSSQQNNRNTRKKSSASSIFKGVSWHKGKNKWQANIRYNKILLYLGSFSNETQAALAYNRAAIELFKEFACINENI